MFFLLAFTAEKSFNLHFTETEINKHWQKLNTIQQIIDQSNLPHDQVKFVINSIDSLKNDIAKQVNEQSKDQNKK
jgi:hypothetical protein